MASPPATGGHLLSNVTNSNIKKYGYLKKQKHGHRRFFVLREPGEGFSARLEYYESEKKWKNKSAPKRLITLDSCLCVNKRADAKYRHLIALYTKDQYFAVAAENEQEQEDWYRVFTDLITEGKVYDSPQSTSSLVGFEENYGMITPATAVYKEVWQVNLKSKGLGQSRNLTGVYRLCLSSRTISFVKLNSETPAVSLQLMNIRRCGHSDSFFFIEVGRSASTGPGELWMQADDSVVAQNIHETILEAMKAMKELSEFRPRSKSQSASTNPISVPTRRNLNNLPPSQTGLVRRSRTDSMAATSPVRKFTSCRIRTASEGDGIGVARPVSMSISVSGSPTGLCSGPSHLSRSHTLSSGRTCRMLESVSGLHHSRSMPVSDSPPSASSPLSLSPRPRTVSSTPDPSHRPVSCSASMSGSLGDSAGFILCDEYGSSPGDTARYLPLARSDTPDSLSSTPPSREADEPCGYMMMDRQGGRRPTGWGDADKAYRKRTYSLTTPRQQRVPLPQPSSASLDEYTLMRAADGGNSASPKVSYPEDYGDIEIGPSRSSPPAANPNLRGDHGYMPMTPGVALPQGGRTGGDRGGAYVPMSPMCVSAPKQIINPRVHCGGGEGYRTASPGSCSLEDSGYMRMLCGSRSSTESLDGRPPGGEYMNMSPGNPHPLQTPPDYFLAPLPSEGRPASSAGGSLPCPAPPASRAEESDQYVLMSPQSQRPTAEDESDYYSVMGGAAPSQAPHPSAPSPIRQGRGDGVPPPTRGRLGRPNRLSLDTLRTLPSMNEHPLPGPNEPRSPGEYINIDFGSPPCAASTPGRSSSSASSLGPAGGRWRSPLSDYMNVERGCGSSPGTGHALSGAERLDSLPEIPPLRPHMAEKASDVAKDDYTEMAFGTDGTPPQLVPQTAGSPGSREKRLSSLEQRPEVPGMSGVFLLGPGGSATMDPDRSAKVIRADPQGRRRHSSETFSSTATVTPVFPSFAHEAKRHSSVENVSARSSEASDDECSGSPVSCETSAAYQNGLNYMALNLLESRDGESCDGGLVGFKAGGGCKGGLARLHATPYVCLGFKEAATTAKD